MCAFVTIPNKYNRTLVTLKNTATLEQRLPMLFSGPDEPPEIAPSYGSLDLRLIHASLRPTE